MNMDIRRHLSVAHDPNGYGMLTGASGVCDSSMLLLHGGSLKVIIRSQTTI